MTVAGATHYGTSNSITRISSFAIDAGIGHIPPLTEVSVLQEVVRFNSCPGLHNCSMVQPPLLLSETRHLHEATFGHWIGHSEDTNSTKPLEPFNCKYGTV